MFLRLIAWQIGGSGFGGGGTEALADTRERVSRFGKVVRPTHLVAMLGTPASASFFISMARWRGMPISGRVARRGMSAPWTYWLTGWFGFAASPRSCAAFSSAPRPHAAADHGALTPRYRGAVASWRYDAVALASLRFAQVIRVDARLCQDLEHKAACGARKLICRRRISLFGKQL